MELPPSPQFLSTSPDFPDLQQTSGEAGIEISMGVAMASGEHNLQREAMELLSPDNIFAEMSKGNINLVKDPAMNKVRMDMSPVVTELQKLALLFCKQDEEKLSLLDEMKCAWDEAALSKPVCKTVSVKTVHDMARMLGDSISMVTALASRYCQSNQHHVQMLQREVEDLTTLACDKVTNKQAEQKAAEDIIRPEEMAFLQPSFMEAEPESVEEPSQAPSPTAARAPTEPTNLRPLTFKTVVPEEEALVACKEITCFMEDILNRLNKALPAFLCLLKNEKASPKIKAEIFRYILTTIHTKGTPKDLLERTDGRNGKPVISLNLFPPLIDVRPNNDLGQTKKTYNYLFDSTLQIFLRNRLITVMLSLTSPYATACVMTLVASGHPYLKTLFNTDEKSPWINALRYSVIQSCICSLEIQEDTIITNNSQLLLPSDLSVPTFQNSVRLTRHIYWPESFENHFSPQDNTKPMKHIDILHNREITFVRNSLQIVPAKKQRIQKRK